LAHKAVKGSIAVVVLIANKLGILKDVDIATIRSAKESDQAAITLYRSFGVPPFESSHLSPRCDQAYYLELSSK
jgi:hypothetical protein